MRKAVRTEGVGGAGCGWTGLTPSAGDPLDPEVVLGQRGGGLRTGASEADVGGVQSLLEVDHRRRGQSLVRTVNVSVLIR